MNIELDETDLPLALCTDDGVMVAATSHGTELLRRLSIVEDLPGRLPASLWGELRRAELGAAVEWRPPASSHHLLGCTRYRHRAGYLLLMKEVSGHHLELSKQLHRQRLEATGQLVASIAHELRNSVASIVYSTDYLRTSGRELEPDALDEATQEVLAASERLQGTVDGLLDYARLGPAVSVPVSLRDVLARAQGFLRPLFREGRHALDVDIARDAGWVQGNTLVIEQIFVNLLLNAVQASSSSLYISIASRVIPSEELNSRRGGWVRVRVSDDGPGIPTSLRDLVFEPFFTTRSGGTGLGLTSAREAAESLGGSLRLDDRSGGACFLIDLPSVDPSVEH